jgi:hypothetical protein
MGLCGAYTARISNIYYGLQVSPSNPQLQVLLRPDPTLHPDDSHVFIARWYNRYFLPTVGDSLQFSLWLVPWIMVNEDAELSGGDP